MCFGTLLATIAAHTANGDVPKIDRLQRLQAMKRWVLLPRIAAWPCRLVACRFMEDHAVDAANQAEVFACTQAQQVLVQPWQSYRTMPAALHSDIVCSLGLHLIKQVCTLPYPAAPTFGMSCLVAVPALPDLAHKRPDYPLRSAHSSHHSTRDQTGSQRCGSTPATASPALNVSCCVGDIVRSMFFVAAGHVSILDANGQQTAMLQPGDYFGEVDGFERQPH